MRAEPGRNSNNSSYIACISPSKSSSAAACSPPSPAIPDLFSKQSMEEVWKDISLASLNDNPTGTVISATSNNPSIILQDFLARPLHKEPPRRRSTVSNGTSLAEEVTLFSSPVPNPGTILSLNSGSDFQYMESGDLVTPTPAVNACSTGVATHNSGFHVFGSHAVFPSFCKKRAQENNGNSEDRRYKRMMKNRESAARSRARKQLELEVAHLLEENAKLKRQQDKLLAAPPQLPKRKTLSRTLTAPF